MAQENALSIIGKNIIAAAKSVVTNTIQPYSYRGLQQGNRNWFFGNDGVDYYFDFSGRLSCIKAYEECPPIAAIINKKTQAFINGKSWVVNSKKKEATTETAKKIKKLLEKPNPLQNESQFKAQQYVYMQLFGYCVVLAIVPVGYNGFINATKLWNIPPNLLDFEEIDDLYYSNTSQNSGFKSITLNYKGYSIPISTKDIFIFKDFTPSFRTQYLPESRIRSLQMPINNIIGAYESRNTLIKRRGALGIISSDVTDASGTVALTPKEKEEVQNEFLQYGLGKNQFQYIITSNAIKWQQMGYPTKDLMLFEEIKDDMCRICDAFSYPFELLANEKGTTFENLKEAKKLLYQDAIMPEAQSWCEQLNSFFGLDEAVETIEVDYSHVAVLQEDEVKKASARLILNQAKKMEYEAGLITMNQWLEAIGEDTIGELGNVRATDIKNTNVPLATIIGVGGVQSIMSVLTAAGLSDEARANTLQIIFGISATDAVSMVAGSNNNNNQQEQSSETNASQQ